MMCPLFVASDLSVLRPRRVRVSAGRPTMLYSPVALERAMTIREVVLRAMSGEISWIQAAEIIGCAPRTVRRWRWRYEHIGYDGLLDRRRGRPSPRRAPFAEVQRVLQLYRAHYVGFNGRHFHQIARRDHGVTLLYDHRPPAPQARGLRRPFTESGQITCQNQPDRS